MFSHVPRVLGFLLSILFVLEFPCLEVNSVDMLSLLLVCILVFPVDSLHVCGILSNGFPCLRVLFIFDHY